MLSGTNGDQSPLSQYEDAALAARASDGDPSAFEELVRRHSSLMRAYVFRMVGSLSEADDVVQNAFLVAWRQLDSLRDPSAVKAWLMRIASREALAYVKKRPTDVSLVGYDASSSDSSQPERVAVRNAQLDALSQALGALPEDQRRCWLLREVAELSYSEIAEELELPVSTVRGLLSRARTSITSRMEGWR